MPDVFLSYSREDQVTARRFAQGLEREGFSVWWDQSLSAGEAFDRVTEKALDDARAVVVLWSKHSVDSNWVRAEATQAHAGQRLVPAMIEPCRRPIMFELTHTADLAGWNGDASDARWRSFIEGLRKSTGKGDASGAGAFVAPTGAGRVPAAVRRPMTWAAAAIAILALAGASFWFLHGSSTGQPAIDASIAVLPFEDMSPGKDQGYFADGVAEQILDVLAAIRDLKVTARTSAMAFKGKGENVQEIGRMLGVAHVLEGSVRKSGSQLRITAQLIRTDTGFHVWSKTYERPIADIFAVQDDIARSVAEALQVTLGVGIANRPGMTHDVEAYDALLEAMKTQGLAEFKLDAINRATQQLQLAVARDPSFAAGWMLLSTLCQTAAILDFPNARSWNEKATAAFSEAQRILPDLPEVLAALADRSANQGQWKDAFEYIDAAEKSAAKYGMSNFDAGRTSLYMRTGRIAESLPLFERQKLRDPLNPAPSFSLTLAYLSNGKVEAARAELQRSLDIGAAPMGAETRGAALLIALSLRDHAGALRALDTNVAFEKQSGTTRKFYTPMREMFDKPEEARAWLHRLLENPRLGAQGFAGSAWFLAYHGEPEAALTALRTMWQRTGSPVSSGGMWIPLYSDMRRLPAFKDLVRETGLVDYWRAYGWGDYCKPTAGKDFECH